MTEVISTCPEGHSGVLISIDAARCGDCGQEFVRFDLHESQRVEIPGVVPMVCMSGFTRMDCATCDGEGTVLIATSSPSSGRHSDMA